MAQLAPIQLEDGTTIYIEASEDWALSQPALATHAHAGTPHSGTAELSRDQVGRAAKGWNGGAPTRSTLPQGLEAMENTIRAYTHHTLNAFRNPQQAGPSGARISRVMLEFGVKLSGEAGIPYITKGSAESNLKVTVECLFPNQPLT